MNYKNPTSPPGLADVQATAIGIISESANEAAMITIANVFARAANANDGSGRVLTSDEMSTVTCQMKGLDFIVTPKDWNTPPPNAPHPAAFGSWNTIVNIKLINKALEAILNLNGTDLPGVSSRT